MDVCDACLANGTASFCPPDCPVQEYPIVGNVLVESYLGTCTDCGGAITKKDEDWAECKTCGDDTYPLSNWAAGIPYNEDEENTSPVWNGALLPYDE